MDATYAHLVRLAHAKPEFRGKLLPLLLKYAAPDYKKYVERKKREGKRPLGRKEWHAKVMSTGEAQTKDLPPRKSQYHEEVNKIMDSNKLHDEDADEVLAYKKQLPTKGGRKKRTPEQIKQDFLAHTKNPETKKRVQGMNAAEFGKLLAFIMEDEEGGEGGMGKAASAVEQALRSATIRLAHQRPELRPVLLPLLKHTAAGPGRPAALPRATGAELFQVYVGPKDWDDVVKEIRLYSDPDTIKILWMTVAKLKQALEPDKRIGEALKALYLLANNPRKAMGAGFFTGKKGRVGHMKSFIYQIAQKVGIHVSETDDPMETVTRHRPGENVPSADAEFEAMLGGGLSGEI